MVEIISPGQSPATLRRRCRWYVEQGVAAVLLVDPRRESIEYFSAGREPSVLRGDELVDLDAVIPKLRFAVREVFAALWVQ